MIINGVLQSMIVGAALAILILALFLKDVKPTIVVAVSIPLSVLTPTLSSQELSSASSRYPAGMAKFCA